MVLHYKASIYMMCSMGCLYRYTVTVRVHEWHHGRFGPRTSHRDLFCHAVAEALAHPYLERLHDVDDEPVCTEPFSFDFERQALTEDQMKQLIFNEAIELNPSFRY